MLELFNETRTSGMNSMVESHSTLHVNMSEIPHTGEGGGRKGKWVVSASRSLIGPNTWGHGGQRRQYLITHSSLFVVKKKKTISQTAPEGSWRVQVKLSPAMYRVYTSGV